MEDSLVSLIQSSFRRISALADLFADLFYSRLFLLDPALERMLDDEPGRREEQLIRLLTTVVEALDDPGRLGVMLESMGRRFAVYGVRAAHYDIVGATLIWTLEQLFGDSFKTPAKAAWREAYRHVAGVAQRAAAAQVDEPVTIVAPLDERLSRPSFPRTFRASAPSSAPRERKTTPEAAAVRSRRRASQPEPSTRAPDTWCDGFPAARFATRAPPTWVSGERISIPAGPTYSEAPPTWVDPPGERMAMFEGIEPFGAEAESPIEDSWRERAMRSLTIPPPSSQPMSVEISVRW